MTTPEDETPKSPEDWLHHWYMKLLEDREYKFQYNRIGTAAQRSDLATVLDRMKHFRAAIAVGIFPDPLTLTTLALYFGKYLEPGGALSLDAAFGLKSVQRVGNPAQRNAATDAMNDHCMRMLDYMRANPQANREEAAAAVILDLYGPAKPDDTPDDRPDVDTMVRNFSAWYRHIAEQARNDRCLGMLEYQTRNPEATALDAARAAREEIATQPPRLVRAAPDIKTMVREFTLAKGLWCVAMSDNLDAEPGAAELDAAEAVLKQFNVDKMVATTLVRYFAVWKREN